MTRGRPKKKPNVDTQAEIAEMVSLACQLLIEPFDDRVSRSADLPSMNSVAEEMGVTIIKLKRLLITGNYYTSSTSRAVQERVKRGMTMDQICSELNIRSSSFYANISYSKGAYNLSEPSLCADQNVRYRKRKAAIKELQAAIATGTVEEQKLGLWKTICLFQDYPFTTTGRGKEKKGAIKFKYTVSNPGSAGGRHYDGPAVEGFGNEMWISSGGEQKKKSISRSTVDLAFHNALEEQGREGFVSGPRKLGVPGVRSNLYAIFLRFGIITAEVRKAEDHSPAHPIVSSI